MLGRVCGVALLGAAGFACTDEVLVAGVGPDAGAPDVAAAADAGADAAGEAGDSSIDALEDARGNDASDASDSGGHADATPIQVRVTTFERQPMVADIEISGAGAPDVSCEHPDPGVRIQKASVAPSETRCRLRGLRPGTSHRAAVRHDGDVTDVDFTAPPALPGFVQSFALEAHATPAPGFRLFDLSLAPDILESSFFAVDSQGVTRFYLPHSRPEAGSIPERLPAGVKLLDDGTLMFAQSYDFHVIDEFGDAVLRLSAGALGVAALHHDVIMLPSGNFVALAWEFRDVVVPGETEISTVLGDELIEFTRAGSVVWRWSALDQLDLGRQRLLARRTIEDPTRPGVLGRDWSHGNAVVYSAADDSLLASFRHLDLLVKIRRRDGVTLWRLGDGGDFTLRGPGDGGEVTLAAADWFFAQHSPEWQQDGTLLLFDNGNGNPYVPFADVRTRVLHLALDETARSATILQDMRTDDYLQSFAGDVDRLPNGNVLVTDANVTRGADQGSARVTEAELATGRVVWRLRAPGKTIYRCTAVTRLPGERASPQ